MHAAIARNRKRERLELQDCAAEAPEEPKPMRETKEQGILSREH